MVSDEINNDREKRISEILVMYNFKNIETMGVGEYRDMGVGDLVEGHS